jgi:DNA-binding beta-propeller fold protein YncE
MLDAASGRVLRSVRIIGVPGIIAVDPRSHRVFVPSSAGTITVLDSQSLSVIRVVNVPGQPYITLVAAGSARVFVSNDGLGPVAMLDARTGAILRLLQTGEQTDLLAVDRAAGRVFVASAIHQRVYTVSAATGDVLRHIDLGSPPRLMAVAERARLLFVASVRSANTPGVPDRAVIHELDEGSGKVRRSLTLAGIPSDISVVPSAQLVFIAESGPRPRAGRLEIFTTRGIDLGAAVIPGGPIGGDAVDVGRGHLFLLSNAPRQRVVRVLQTRTLRLLETIRIPRGTVSWAFDQRTSRLFVASRFNRVSVIALGG